MSTYRFELIGNRLAATGLRAGICLLFGCALFVLPARAADAEAKTPAVAPKVDEKKTAPVKVTKTEDVKDEVAAEELESNKKRNPFKVTAIMFRRAILKAKGPGVVMMASSKLPVIRMTGVMEVEGERLATVQVEGVGSLVLQKGMTYAFIKGEVEGRAKVAPGSQLKAKEGQGSKQGDLDSQVIHFSVKNITATSVTLETMDGVEVNISME